MLDLKLDVPASFYRKEVRSGFLVTEEIKKVWAVELDLLMELDRVCRKNNIKYSLAYGSLIGAVRHGGFIPWDDDIDIVLERNEYEKLCACSNEFDSPFFFQTHDTDKDYYLGHAQLRNSLTTAILDSQFGYAVPYNQGIFIDIFPLDRVPSAAEADLLYRKDLVSRKRRIMNWYGYSRGYSATHKTLKKRIFHPFVNMIATIFPIVEYQYREYEKLCKKYNECNSDRYACVILNHFSQAYFTADEIADIEYVPFEFVTAPIPMSYDSILHRVYGDYLTPREEPTAHGGIFFDAEKSFIDYIGGRAVR